MHKLSGCILVKKTSIYAKTQGYHLDNLALSFIWLHSNYYINFKIVNNRQLIIIIFIENEKKINTTYCMLYRFIHVKLNVKN